MSFVHNLCYCVLCCAFIRHRWNIYICLPKNNNNKCDCILLFVRDCTGKVRLQRKVNRQRRQAYEFKIIIKYNESDNTRPMSSQVQIEGCTRTRQGEHKTQEQQEKFWAFVPTKDTGTSSEADNPNKRKQIGHDKCLLLQLKMEFIFFFNEKQHYYKLRLESNGTKEGWGSSKKNKKNKQKEYSNLQSTK